MLLPLPDQYAHLMARFAGQNIFGVIIDDSAMLRDLVRLGLKVKRESHGCSPIAAVRRIELLVLGTLASTFTFNSKELETGVEFPSSLPLLEQERWQVGSRVPEATEVLDLLAPGRYQAATLRQLSTQLGARIGDCAVYTITLGIILAACDLCDKLTLIGKPPHAWVCCDVKRGGHGHHSDLAMRSHGSEGDHEDRFHTNCSGATVQIQLIPFNS